MLSARTLTWSLVVFTLCNLATPPQARADYPANCVPAPGGTAECTAKLLEPWHYFKNTCAVPVKRESEGAAFQDELNEWTTVCNLTHERIGWLTELTTFGGCQVNNTRPDWNFGNEIANVSVYHFEWDWCATQQHDEQENYAVFRRRYDYCPRGYSASVNGYCTRGPYLDPAKNAGPPCPKCGNPIGTGTGNKYQEEVDYQGSGSFPLVFKRHYNSQLRMKDNFAGYFTFSNYGSQLGTPAYGRLFLSTPENGDHFKNLGLDAMGQNWRHHYQRSINVTQIVNGSYDDDRVRLPARWPCLCLQSLQRWVRRAIRRE